MIALILAAAAASIMSVGNPVVTADLAPAVRVSAPVEACPATVFTGWQDAPGCDLDGSQTWILVDEATDLTVDPVAECADAGGIHAVSVSAPLTHYCIDIDY